MPPALLQTVLDVMRNCDSLDSRQQVMAAIIKSSAEVSRKQGARQVVGMIAQQYLAGVQAATLAV